MDKNAQHRGIRRVVSTHLPTVFGVFNLISFERAGFDPANMTKGEHETALVMMLGDLRERVPLLRIHSQCLTGEVLDLCAVTAQASWKSRCPPFQTKDPA